MRRLRDLRRLQARLHLGGPLSRDELEDLADDIDSGDLLKRMRANFHARHGCTRANGRCHGCQPDSAASSRRP